MMKNIFLLCWLAELYFHFLSDDRKCERRLQISLVTSFLSSPRSSLPESQFFLFFPSYQRKSICLQSTKLVPKVLPTRSLLRGWYPITVSIVMIHQLYYARWTSIHIFLAHHFFEIVSSVVLCLY